jgi:hypothetical protein
MEGDNGHKVCDSGCRYRQTASCCHLELKGSTPIRGGPCPIDYAYLPINVKQ